MTELQRHSNSAFVLQARKFRESSLIADLFTQTDGVITVIVRGLRKKNAGQASAMQLFQELAVSYSRKGAGGLCYVNQLEARPQSFRLSGWAIYYAYYVNELISRFLPKQDPCPDIYRHYKHCLKALVDASPADSNSSIPQLSLIETELRYFELCLLEQSGFALPLEFEMDSGAPINAACSYHFQPAQGATRHPQGKISGNTLLSLANKKITNAKTLNEAKYLMRDVIDYHLEGRSIKSRELLSKLQQRL